MWGNPLPEAALGIWQKACSTSGRDKAIYPSFCCRKPWISFKTWQWCILVHDEERNCKKLSGVVWWIIFLEATAGHFLSTELCQRFLWVYPYSVVVDVGGAVNLPVRHGLQKQHVKQKFVLCILSKLEAEITQAGSPVLSVCQESASLLLSPCKSFGVEVAFIYPRYIYTYTCALIQVCMKLQI